MKCCLTMSEGKVFTVAPNGRSGKQSEKAAGIDSWLRPTTSLNSVQQLSLCGPNAQMGITAHFQTVSPGSDKNCHMQLSEREDSDTVR